MQGNPMPSAQVQMQVETASRCACQSEGRGKTTSGVWAGGRDEDWDLFLVLCGDCSMLS